MRNLFFNPSTLLAFFILLNFNSFSQIEDDVYYTPPEEIKPLKNRKMYTKIDDRIPEEGESIYFFAAARNSYWHYDKDNNQVYLYIFLQGIKHEIEKERPAYNLSFVLDRSGSMSGSKIEYTKQALSYAIDLLGEKDYISIVQYNEVVDVVSKPVAGFNKSVLHESVKSLYANGSTNLCSGMLEGFSLIENSKVNYSEDENVIHKVILLSDGLANTGVIDPELIAEKAKNKFLSESTSLSTIGVGADYNEELMTVISQEGGGNYHFIDKPEQLKRIFEKEFLDMKALIAKNTKIKIEFPYHALRLNKVFEYPYVLKDDVIEITPGDYFSEQQSAILIKFDVREDFSDNIVFNTSIDYDNVILSKNHIHKEKLIIIEPSNNEKDFEAGVNADADMGYALMLCSDLLKEAQIESDRRNFKKADELLDEGILIMNKHFRLVKPNPYLIKIKDNLLEYKAELPELKRTKNVTKFKLFQKKAKYRNYKGSYKSVRFL